MSTISTVGSEERKADTSVEIFASERATINLMRSREIKQISLDSTAGFRSAFVAAVAAAKAEFASSIAFVGAVAGTVAEAEVHAVAIDCFSSFLSPGLDI